MQYATRGVCSRAIDVELDGDVVKHVEFYGGCNGNLKAIARALLPGEDALPAGSDADAAESSMEQLSLF